MKILASRRTFLSGMVGSLGLIAAGGLASCFGSQRQAIGDFNRVPLYPSKPDLLDPLAYLAACGTLAPSPFNTQPWVFYPRPSALEIYPDFSRKRAMADPHHRELAIALGAASEAMRVAAPVAGFSAEVETGTAISTRTPAVTVRLSPSTNPEAPLYPLLFSRHTNRLEFMPVPISDADRAKLLAVPLPDGVRVFSITEPGYLRRLAAVSAELERERLSRETLRPDIARWLRTDADEAARRGDGIALERLTRIDPYGHESASGDYWHDQPEREARRIRSASMMLLLCTTDDTPVDWVKAGMATLRLELAAESLRLRYQPHNQTVRSSDHIPLLADLFKARGVPQMLLRFGYAPAWGASPRLSYKQVMLEPDEPDGPMDNWDL